MALRKSDLYASLWESCDELRGGMDASQYKDYILSLLFIKYVSDKHSDSNSLLDIPEELSFQAITKLKNKLEIGERLNQSLRAIFKNAGLADDMVDVDFDDPNKLGKDKERIDRLSKLVGIFERPELNFASQTAEGDDLIGDAYEYLMRHFATESGKSKGQFYTPAEVSMVMAKLLELDKTLTSPQQTLYDPTCGSGSLLLKVASEVPEEIGAISLYGQEMDTATRALAVMNMYVHDTLTAVLEQGNTLANPQFLEKNGELKRFDYIVANPPFSYKRWTTGFDPEHDLYRRFQVHGIPPEKNGDYAFLLHILTSLKDTGAVILPHGVLFRGNKEAVIRKSILEDGYIKGIVGLPPNLFYGTGIPACIIVLTKRTHGPERPVFMIDASKGFMKDGAKNRLRSQDVQKIVDVFTRQEEIPRYSRLVPYAEIEANDFNLNLPRYIDSAEPEDIHSLEGHLQGGIPNYDLEKLNDYWNAFPTLKTELFEPIPNRDFSQPKHDTTELKGFILNHPDFSQYRESKLEVFELWWEHATQALTLFNDKLTPKQKIGFISDWLLKNFKNSTLLDKYDVYQLLMQYWADTLQDDIYLLTTHENTWLAARGYGALEKGSKDTPDFQVDKVKYKATMLPSELVAQHAFPEQYAMVQKLADAYAQAQQAVKALDEETNEEEDALADIRTEKGKLSLSEAKKRRAYLKKLKSPEFAEELAAVEDALRLLEAEKTAKDHHKELDADLNQYLKQAYDELTEADCKTLLVEGKWHTELRHQLETLVDRQAQALATRLVTLQERYAQPVAELEAETKRLHEKVQGHLQRIGLNTVAP